MSDILKMKNVFLFAGGVLFGTAGIKALSGRDAKKVYTNCTAGEGLYLGYGDYGTGKRGRYPG